MLVHNKKKIKSKKKKEKRKKKKESPDMIFFTQTRPGEVLGCTLWHKRKTKGKQKENKRKTKGKQKENKRKTKDTLCLKTSQKKNRINNFND